MKELVVKNANLGLTFHRIEWNGVETVWGDDMRDALRWGRTVDMVDGLKVGKEYFKVDVSALESISKDLFGNFQKNQDGRGRPQKYTYLITRQGVTRLIATRRPHEIKDDPELAAYLDRLQDWIFGEVLPEVLATGSYVGKPLSAGQHAIEGVPKSYADALRFIADEYEAHELTIGEWNSLKTRIGEVQDELDEAIRTKGQISNSREAKAMGELSALSRKIDKLENELANLKILADRYTIWIENIKKGRWGYKNDERQMKLF